MKAWGGLALVVIAALGLAVLALAPPAPRGLHAPPHVFSARRAMADVIALSAAPRPLGTPQLHKAQARLAARMATLGLAPQIHGFETPRGMGFNLLGVLPGRDRSLPAVLLMAHTDSVPTGPGAADDAAGVAAILETVRALQSEGPRRRDVMVLLTDGEEPGLYGAKAFFAGDPARSHVGVVINLEARGNRGRAAMFETSRDAGLLITFLINNNAISGASSLMPDLYRRLPNDTDLSAALSHGYKGVNLAFFAGFDAYHRPSDTPQRLDPASLQDIGDQTLAAAHALAGAKTLPPDGPDQVYADVVGRPVLQYPAAAGWGLLALAVVGMAGSTLRALQDRQTSVAGIAGGFAAFLALILAVGAALFASGLLRGQLAAGHFAPLLRHFGQALSGAALLAAGLALIWLWGFSRLLRPASLQLGALKAIALAAIVLQVVAPLDAFIVAWPLLLAVVGMILARDRPFVLPLAVLAGSIQVFYWTGQIFSLVGQETPVALTPFLALAALTLLPLAPARAGRTAALLGLGWTGAGLALSLVALA